MTDPNYTAIQIVVDRSGSMQTIKSDAEGALAAFFKDQANVPGKATVRLSQFDIEYECVYGSTLVGDVPTYTLHPRGGTALNDAIGRAIHEFGNELSALDEDARPGVVTFVIITDGLENSSREFTTSQVKTLVQHQESKWNWKFVFLAANQDAVLTGQDYGFQRGSTMTFNTSRAGTHAVGQSLSHYHTVTRSGATYDFSDAERAAAVQEDDDKGDQS